MKALSIDDSEISQIFSVLAGILHLSEGSKYAAKCLGIADNILDTLLATIAQRNEDVQKPGIVTLRTDRMYVHYLNTYPFFCYITLPNFKYHNKHMLSKFTF